MFKNIPFNNIYLKYNYLYRYNKIVYVFERERERELFRKNGTRKSYEISDENSETSECAEILIFKFLLLLLFF